MQILPSLASALPSPRLPRADPAERRIVSALVDDILRRPPDESSGLPLHIEALELSVPLVEAVLDDDPYDVPHEMLAQLTVFSAWPMVAESMALQAAFGRPAAEAELDDLARLADRAHRRGLSIDDYVQQESRAGTLRRSRMANLLLGDTRRRPDAERMRRAEDLFLRALSLVTARHRAELFIAVAWLVWARGDTARAIAYTAESTRIAPGHPVAIGLAVHFARVAPRWVTQPR